MNTFFEAVANSVFEARWPSLLTIQVCILLFLKQFLSNVSLFSPKFARGDDCELFTFSENWKSGLMCDFELFLRSLFFFSNFQVEAEERDTVERKKIFVEIYINITDINDNVPVFHEIKNVFQIKENNQVPYLIHRVKILYKIKMGSSRKCSHPLIEDKFSAGVAKKLLNSPYTLALSTGY